MLKQKIMSRKFILTVVMFALLIILFFFSSSITVTQAELLTKAVVILAAYIFGESLVDAARVYKKYDTNNNGTLDQNEFINLIVDTVINTLKGENSNDTNNDQHS